MLWILQFLPDWVYYGILGIGLVGLAITYLLRFIPIPAIFMYKTPIQLGSIALIVIGTFMSGAIHDNNAWLDRVHEMEAKVAKAEQESKEANDKINTKVEQTKTKIVEKQIVVKQYIDREVAKYDNQCVIPKEFIKAINDSAESPK